jgi:hypothetical protein
MMLLLAYAYILGMDGWTVHGASCSATRSISQWFRPYLGRGPDQGQARTPGCTCTYISWPCKAISHVFPPPLWINGAFVWEPVFVFSVVSATGAGAPVPQSLACMNVRVHTILLMVRYGLCVCLCAASSLQRADNHCKIAGIFLKKHRRSVPKCRSFSFSKK